jgi:hypothetical protein
MNDPVLVLVSCALLLSTGAAEPAGGAAQGESRDGGGNPTTADGVRRFSGTVVQPDGRPTSGAHIVFERVDLADLVELKATTDDRGRFDFSIPADQIPTPFGTRIVALKPGFGRSAEFKSSSSSSLRRRRVRISARGWTR